MSNRHTRLPVIETILMFVAYLVIMQFLQTEWHTALARCGKKTSRHIHENFMRCAKDQRTTQHFDNGRDENPTEM